MIVAGVLLVLLALIGLVTWGLISWMGLVSVLALYFVGVSLILMLMILIQRPRGGGLSGAFGGAGGSAQSAFGAKAGDMLTVGTVCLFVAFLGLAMGLTWTIRPSTAATPPELISPGEPAGEQPAEEQQATTQQATTQQAAPPAEPAAEAPPATAPADAAAAPAVPATAPAATNPAPPEM